MERSKTWIEHFNSNSKLQRINWQLKPSITNVEKKNILPSLKAWQLGETSDGSHLKKASAKYAIAISDAFYPIAVELFIKEEQKHGNNLGRYLDKIGEKRLRKNWADTLFRKFRYFNTSMELWTLAVITVESAAQVFYQALKDATQCELLKQICTDILIDEAFHIDFQLERFLLIHQNKNDTSKFLSYYLYKGFYYFTIHLVWFAYRKCFVAGNVSYERYRKKMDMKFYKTIGKLKHLSKQVLVHAPFYNK